MSVGHTAVRPLDASSRRLSLTEAIAALPETDIEAGQELRDSGSARLVSKGGGLWVLQVAAAESAVSTASEAAPTEAELALDGRKIKGYRCDCAAFADRQSCPHLAALLALTQLSKLPKTNTAARTRTTTVTTKRLVSLVADDDLRQFVLDYATKHPAFSLELRVAFAQNLPVPQRFIRVVERVLQRNAERYSAKDGRRIAEALRSWETQRRDWMAERNWLDVFDLVTTLVPRLVVIVAKSDKIPTDLPQYIHDAVAQLAQIVRSSPPPVLRERLDDWLSEQLERGAYYRVDLDWALYQLAEALGWSLDRISKQIDQALAGFGESPRRLQARLTLDYRRGDLQAAEQLLIHHLDQPELLFTALTEEVAQERYGHAVRLAEAAFRQNPPHPLRLRLLRFITAAALPAHQPDLLHQYAPELVVTTLDLQEISNPLDAISDEQKREVLTHTYDLLEQHGTDAAASHSDSERVAATKLQLLLQMQRYAEAEELLYRLESATLIAQYLPQLTARLKADDFLLLADTKIREELQRRLGKAPAEWVAQLLDAIARRDRHEIVPRLVARLRREFAQRQALISALDQARL